MQRPRGPNDLALLEWEVRSSQRWSWDWVEEVRRSSRMKGCTVPKYSVTEINTRYLKSKCMQNTPWRTKIK